MPLKSVTRFPRPISFKMGRNRPTWKKSRLKFADYLRPGLTIPIPEAHRYTKKALRPLHNIYGNDVLGDCVIAEMFHTLGVTTGNANNGSAVIPTQDEVIAAYSAIGGYVPNDPSTDNGCDEQTALNYWKNTGILGHKIVGWISVDPTNPVEFKTAIWLFENLMYGIELPDEWVNPIPSDSAFIWDVAGNPDMSNGHCVGAYGYDVNSVEISTWGMLGYLTDAATAKYAGQPSGELYTVLTEDVIVRATGKAPNGFDFEQLQADFAALG